MAQARQYLAEILRAGLVLALVLFALGANRVEAQVGASPAVTVSILQAATDFCGGGWGDKLGAHAPCHACRSATPLLPAPPATAERAFTTPVAIAYVPAPRAPLTIAAIAVRPLPRGPPPRA